MTEALQIPRLGASACVWRDGKVLVIQRAKPPYLWSLPGGSVEFGETAQAAARRELHEETSVTAKLETFVGLYEVIIAKPAFHFAIACYCGHWEAGEAQALSDAQDVRWLDPANLQDLEFAPHIMEAIGRSEQLLGL
jgi:8-oxo-dGTP diphosphatase